jgi:hypothetical protein
MTTTINANTSAGLVYTADTSGIVKLQSNGVTTNAVAWVNFNGTGTVAIRASYNVSSITDNGTGDYTINFTNAMPDANYTYGYGLAYDTSGSTPTNYTALSIKQGAFATFNTTTACRIYTVYTASGAGGPNDMEVVRVAFFGN